MTNEIIKPSDTALVLQEVAQLQEVESVAAANMAYARENKEYERYVEAWYVYVMAHRATTETVLPYIEHGGNGSNQYESKGNTRVTLPDFGFTRMEWSRRTAELEADIDEYLDECKAIGSPPSFAAIYKIVKNKKIAKRRAEYIERGKRVIESGQNWNVYHGDIRTWTPPRQYDFIITDPPYPAEYLPLYDALAQRAARWLKPGGLLVAMSAHYYINKIYPMMDKHLEYFWTASYLVPGESAGVFQKHINTQWKPLIMYQRKAAPFNGRAFADVFRSDANDKDFHEWGQSESGLYDIISKICIPGHTILDPFCGGGSTGVAALKYGCLFDGVDVDMDCVNITKARLNDVQQA